MRIWWHGNRSQLISILIGVRRTLLMHRSDRLLAWLIFNSLKPALARFDYCVPRILTSSLVIILADLTLKVIKLLFELIDLLRVKDISMWLILLIWYIRCIDLFSRSDHILPLSSRWMPNRMLSGLHITFSYLTMIDFRMNIVNGRGLFDDMNLI